MSKIYARNIAGANRPTPSGNYDWGVAWFGVSAFSGHCGRCQRAGRVYQGYNGGAHVGTYCGPCREPVAQRLA